MRSSKFRFLIIGCGRISPRHIDSLRQIPDAEIVGVVDCVAERADQTAQKLGVKAFHSVAEAASWGQFDVANICTPSGLHAEHALAVMRSGKHVVVEKPMALTIADADEMIQTAQKFKVQLFVVKQNRFNLPVVALRKALEENRFGRLTLGTVRVRWCRTQDYYDQASWRGTWALDGGVFANQASHHIDLLEWMMGEVDTVFTKTATQLVDIECEDMGLAVLKFKSGALGLIEATTALRPKDLEGSLSLIGEKGSVEISGFAVNQIRHFNFVDKKPSDDEMLLKFSENPPNVYGFGHLSYLKNVMDVLNQKAIPLVDGQEGRKSLELINALYVSAETGKEVKVSDNHLQSKLGQKPNGKF